MKSTQIIVNPTHHDFKRSFVLIKPSRPFFVQGEDYEIVTPFTSEVLAKARIVHKHTCKLNEIPEYFTYLYRDLNLTHFKNIYFSKDHITYDILVFSTSAYYNDFYVDKPKAIQDLRETNNKQLSLDLS